MLGKPVIKGTRLTVELVLEKLAAGETVDQLLEAHPRLTREVIQAALAYTAKTLRSDFVYPTNYPVAARTLRESKTCSKDHPRA